mmetsp:Transcript_31198/g.90079  ORF Transcript_31198/g.90079 Transcript_31198/m.90079 type:complete len:135 (-) Transcript_31198:56-460(-)
MAMVAAAQPMTLLEHGPAGEGAKYRIGEVVEVAGLSSAPQYNGQLAEVLEVDATKGRLEIRVADGSVKSISAQHIRPRPAVAEEAEVIPEKQSPEPAPAATSSWLFARCCAMQVADPVDSELASGVAAEGVVRG